jgi:cyclohexyl-isocyanide hydratase
MALQIGFLSFPHVTQLDLTGPAQVLARVPGAAIHLVWKQAGPIPTDAGFSLVATSSFGDCPPLDVLCVPGGLGISACLEDPEVLAWVRRQGEQARYVTSVCTGSLLLGAAGLLQGYRSACHWAFRELLPHLGALPVAERVVRDRNRISGGGVTAGIDFALTLAAELAGTEVAKLIQLGLEYDPAPPFDCGSPERADPQILATFRARIQPELERRLTLIKTFAPPRQE